MAAPLKFTDVQLARAMRRAGTFCGAADELGSTARYVAKRARSIGIVSSSPRSRPPKRTSIRSRIARGTMQMLQVPATRREVAAWKRQAKAAGMTLNEWIRNRLI